MGVALENARLFEEIQRRTRESAALAEVGRDISSTLDLPTVMDRIAHHAKELLVGDHSAIFLRQDGTNGAAPTFRAIVAEGENAAQLKDMVVVAGVGIIGSIIQNGRAEFVNDADHDPRAVQIPGTDQASDERLMVAPLRAGKAVKGAMAVWRTGGKPFQDERARIPGGPVAGRGGRDGERAALRRGAAARRRTRHGQHGVAATRRQARPVGADRSGRRADPRAVQGRHRLRGAARPRHRRDQLSVPPRRRQRDSRPRGEGSPAGSSTSGEALLLNSDMRAVPRRSAPSGSARREVVPGRADQGRRPRRGRDQRAEHQARRRVRRRRPAAAGNRSPPTSASRCATRGSSPRRRRRARGRDRQRGQELVPGHDEPRDPHADERGDRHERPAARHAARRRAARLRGDDPRFRRRAADHHQRHPRLLEDRSRADGHRGAAVRPARVRRVGARPGRRARGGEAPRPRVPVRRRRAGGRQRRRDAAAAGPAQPAVQCRQVHRARRSRADGERAQCWQDGP